MCKITCKLKYSKELLGYKVKNATTYMIIRVTMNHGVLTWSDVQANSYPHRGTRGEGGWNPFTEFLKC